MSPIEPNSFEKSEMAEELELLASLQHDIATRLRRVCAGMSEEIFDQLVRDIAAMKLKYGADSNLSGSLRAELSTILHEPEKPT